ncbi:MAG TPA: hypothetical protein VGX48_01735 [Pyrinomonadaceae bacterium]|jgi:hypothetical protein|nr:hypothetical protein [Pyrinomonadaceae bacterium]
MLKTFRAAVLILTLSCFAYAGDMPNGAPSSTGTTEGEIQNGVYGDVPNGAPGEMPNGTGTSSQTSTNTLDAVEVTFNLMQSLLGLF